MNTGSALAIFTITLSKAVTEPVQVEWFTSDGTAKAGVDYAANKGTVVFAPGETAKTVDILVYGRAVGTENRSFFVEMLPPTNAILGAAIGECIIHVDTTGSEPVTQIIVPTGPQGLTGKSAYQSWLDTGHSGSEADFLEWLKPSPEEIAEEVAPLLDVGNTVLTAEGTETLGHPDGTTVKAVARRVAYAAAAKIATVVLADGDNTITNASLTGDAVNFAGAGFYPRIWNGATLSSPKWTLDANGSITVYGATAGNVLYATQYDVISDYNSRESILAVTEPATYNKFKSFEKGSNDIKTAKDALLWEGAPAGQGPYFAWAGTFPKSVPQGSTPESTGGIGNNAWVDVGDASIKTLLGSQLVPGTEMVMHKNGQTVNTILSGLNAVQFGVPSGGTEDATLKLQQFIEQSTGNIDLGGGVFLISKNPALATSYPTESDFSDGTHNFSPCLAMVGKKGVKIFNGTLIVKTHGMDALALVNCKNVTVDLNIEGPGIFPAIDPLSGYAEKGDVGFGYDSAQILGPNNGVDTSGYNSGTFDQVAGQFPQYNADGSQAAGWRSTWGTFLGGYIGSWACGVKVQRACKGIFIQNSHIKGFNFASVGIGIRNTAAPYGSSDYTVDSDVPEGVLVCKCTIENCYTAGIQVLCGYKLGYMKNVIKNVGHPNGNDTVNASYDPGYGITHGRNRRIRNVTVDQNFISNCRRKSIDFHGGGQAIITNNHCLESGVVGIYAKCGQGWSPNYEPYNLTIANNYVRTRDIPASTTASDPYPTLSGSRYTRCIDVGGGGEPTQATYPFPFAKVLNNYCEMKAYDGVAIATGAGDDNYYVFHDIDVSHNTVVLKCSNFNCLAQGITINAGAAATKFYREQHVKMNFNTVKQLNNLNVSYRSSGFTVQGIPRSLIAHGNELDCNASAQTGSFATMNVDARTHYSLVGNKASSYADRSNASGAEIMFFDNIKILRPNGSALLSIPIAIFRGVWQLTVAGGGDYFGSKQTQFASTGSGGTGSDVVRSATTGGIANIGIGATAVTLPAVTGGDSPVTVNVKPLIQYSDVT